MARNLHIHYFMIFDLSSIFLFIHILFSLWLSRKTLYYNHWTLFLPSTIRKICIIFNLLLICGISLLNISSLFLKCLLLYIPCILAYFVSNLFHFYWKEQFFIQFEFFINSLITRIKTGYGFRSAFKMAITCLPQTHFQNHFMEILESIIFSKSFRKEIQFSPMQQMLLELKHADQSTRCLDYLENLRHQIHIRSQFRKKVKSVLFQFRTQAFILCILYICLFIFVLFRHGLQYPKLLFSSICLFTMGFFFLFQCGRKIKWTI